MGLNWEASMVCKGYILKYLCHLVLWESLLHHIVNTVLVKKKNMFYTYGSTSSSVT